MKLIIDFSFLFFSISVLFILFDDSFITPLYYESFIILIIFSFSFYLTIIGYPLFKRNILNDNTAIDGNKIIKEKSDKNNLISNNHFDFDSMHIQSNEIMLENLKIIHEQPLMQSTPISELSTTQQSFLGDSDFSLVDCTSSFSTSFNSKQTNESILNHIHLSSSNLVRKMPLSFTNVESMNGLSARIPSNDNVDNEID